MSLFVFIDQIETKDTKTPGLIKFVASQEGETVSQFYMSSELMDNLAGQWIKIMANRNSPPKDAQKPNGSYNGQDRTQSRMAEYPRDDDRFASMKPTTRPAMKPSTDEDGRAYKDDPPPRRRTSAIEEDER